METNTDITCLRRLLGEDSSRLISGEVQLRNNLGDWMSKEQSPLFKAIMDRYLDMTERHIRDLEQFCEDEQLSSVHISNRVIKALMEELNEKLASCSCNEVKTACLLAGIQSINHYKISAYGTAAAYAGAIRLEKAALFFHQAEHDEKIIDEELSRLATREINNKALTPVIIDE